MTLISVDQVSDFHLLPILRFELSAICILRLEIDNFSVQAA